jgi:hypothetical protein
MVAALRPLPLSGLGLTGLEPVTLRLSSACSNQLSYRPTFFEEYSAFAESSGKVSGDW